MGLSLKYTLLHNTGITHAAVGEGPSSHRVSLDWVVPFSDREHLLLLALEKLPVRTGGTGRHYERHMQPPYEKCVQLMSGYVLFAWNLLLPQGSKAQPWERIFVKTSATTPSSS